MKDSIITKLETLSERQEEVGHLLGEPEVISDQNKFRDLSKEYSQLEEVVSCFAKYNQLKDDLASAEEMMKDSDPDMKEMAVEDFKECKAQIGPLETELQKLFNL